MAENTLEADYWRSAQQWVAYQQMLDATLQPVLDHLLQAADPQAGQAVLDIGCGTGASSMAAARLVGAKGRVLGADVSDLLLDHARARLKAAGLLQVEYTEGDAQRFGFEAAAFDLVISRFGVMFFDSPVAAFRNIARAMKPKAQMLFMCWAAMDQNPWFAIPRGAAVDRLGAPPPPDPHGPGPMAFADGAYVAGLLTEAGLKDITVQPVDLHLTPAGNLAQVAEFATRVGPASRVVDERGGSEDDVLAIEAEVARQLAQFDTAQGLRVPACINLVRATA